jgi:hypothetical protein
MTAPFNLRQFDFWGAIQRRFESFGLGFLPLGVMKAIFISLAILILLPLGALALAAVVLVVALLLVLWIALFLIKLPFRILGLFLRAGAVAGTATATEDDGRRNVKVIQRSDNPG